MLKCFQYELRMGWKIFDLQRKYFIFYLAPIVSLILLFYLLHCLYNISEENHSSVTIFVKKCLVFKTK